MDEYQHYLQAVSATQEYVKSLYNGDQKGAMQLDGILHGAHGLFLGLSFAMRPNVCGRHGNWLFEDIADEINEALHAPMLVRKRTVWNEYPHKETCKALFDCGTLNKLNGNVYGSCLEDSVVYDVDIFVPMSEHFYMNIYPEVRKDPELRDKNEQITVMSHFCNEGFPTTNATSFNNIGKSYAHNESGDLYYIGLNTKKHDYVPDLFLYARVDRRSASLEAQEATGGILETIETTQYIPYTPTIFRTHIFGYNYDVHEKNKDVFEQQAVFGPTIELGSNVS